MTWSFILRIIVAGLLGGMIGLEREIRAKEAGLRTHFIVALGSALFMIISQYAFTGRFDGARVAAQVVSGIGFIGAGVIIFQKNAVRGVTTAAGLWVAAAIGLACGAGMYPVSTAAAALTVICLEAMHIITNRYGERLLTVKVTPADNEKLLFLLDSLKKSGIDVESFSLAEGDATIQIRMKHKDYMETVRTVLKYAKGLSVDII